jgi:hypothetical protein
MFMRALYARQPTAEERRELEAGLQSDSALTLRRCQIILLSVDEQLKVQAIGQRIGRSDQTVREVIHAFNEERGCGASMLNRAVAKMINGPLMMQPVSNYER